jgi:cyclopropane fatty-acyl-phospholipid synthase-like methyltransferase
MTSTDLAPDGIWKWKRRLRAWSWFGSLTSAIVIISVILGSAFVVFLRYVWFWTVQARFSNASDAFSVPSHRRLEDVFYAELTDTSPLPIEADYEKKDISFLDSYNIGFLREWPNSSPHDATVLMADIEDGHNVLDVGCGAGHFAVYLCSRFRHARCTCIVDSAHLFSLTLRNVRRAGLQERVEVVHDDFDSCLTKDGKYGEDDKDNKDNTFRERFDRVVCLESIGYSRDRPRLLRGLYAALRPGGSIFVKTPCFRDQGVPDGFCRRVVRMWRYNFSDPLAWLEDIRSVFDKDGASKPDTRFAVVSWFANVAFVNPLDILHLLRYVVVNKINVRRDHPPLWHLGLYMRELYVSASKTTNPRRPRHHDSTELQ